MNIFSYCFLRNKRKYFALFLLFSLLFPLSIIYPYKTLEILLLSEEGAIEVVKSRVSKKKNPVKLNVHQKSRQKHNW